MTAIANVENTPPEELSVNKSTSLVIAPHASLHSSTFSLSVFSTGHTFSQIPQFRQTSLLTQRLTTYHPKYYGRSYQSWTTGTSAWCMMGLYEGILGVQRDYQGLRICPAFPSNWQEAEMTRRFRGADYRIRLRRGENKGIDSRRQQPPEKALVDQRPNDDIPLAVEYDDKM